MEGGAAAAGVRTAVRARVISAVSGNARATPPRRLRRDGRPAGGDAGEVDVVWVWPHPPCGCGGPLPNVLVGGSGGSGFEPVLAQQATEVPPLGLYQPRRL
jgi:hypothetical protein